jgi:CheY-like chemotaxis protein
MSSNIKIPVLIVDDRPENLISLEALLDDMGLDLVQAQSGNEALRQTLYKDFALVLLDVQMPEMDGYEATRRIREDPRFTRLPVIALTAKAMKGDREACLKAGASDYITKPVDLDRLLSLLRVWLYNQG